MRGRRHGRCRLQVQCLQHHDTGVVPERDLAVAGPSGQLVVAVEHALPVGAHPFDQRLGQGRGLQVLVGEQVVGQCRGLQSGDAEQADGQHQCCDHHLDQPQTTAAWLQERGHAVPPLPTEPAGSQTLGRPLGLTTTRRS